MRIPSAIKAKYDKCDAEKANWAIVQGEWTLYNVIIDRNAGLPSFIWVSDSGDVSEPFADMDLARAAYDKMMEAK